METIIIKEYEDLLIRDKRDIKNKTISHDDAKLLHLLFADKRISAFKWGYQKITAQKWVGTITLGDLNIEILPKLYGYISDGDLRSLLIRMLLISHSDSSIRGIPGLVKTQKESLIEAVISTFISSLESYLTIGMVKGYKAHKQNINKVKGRILFNKQFTKNVLKPTKFWCKYSSFSVDSNVNRFIKACLIQMYRVTTDHSNKERIKNNIPLFENVTDVSREQALSLPIKFDLTNQQAKTSYLYGLMFLQNMGSSLTAGNTKMLSMLFDMNLVFERFIWRVSRWLIGSDVIYQMSDHYLLQDVSNGRRYIKIKPDIAIKNSADGSVKLIDTKWKIPKKFAKESDAYQMNSYSSCIPNVERIILLYPLVLSDSMVGDYYFEDGSKIKRILSIRTIDLTLLLDWKAFSDKFIDILA